MIFIHPHFVSYFFAFLIRKIFCFINFISKQFYDFMNFSVFLFIIFSIRRRKRSKLIFLLLFNLLMSLDRYRASIYLMKRKRNWAKRNQKKCLKRRVKWRGGVWCHFKGSSMSYQRNLSSFPKFPRWKTLENS